jgi:hypothetical protein
MDRQVEVAKNDMTVVIHHHILQFDVSMNDSKAVEVIDRAGLDILHEHATLPASLEKAYQFCGCELLVRLGHMKTPVE